MMALPEIRLPPPELKGKMSLEETISARKSVRRYRKATLSMTQFGQLLWAGQGLTHGRLRAVPSAGATYPLELLAVAGNDTIEGLTAGIYHYNVDAHSISLQQPGDRRSEMSAAALGQECVAAAPLIIAVCALLSRTAYRYGRRAERYVHLETGHVGQNVSLQAVALGLGTVMVGAFDDEQVRRIMGLDEPFLPLYLIPVGSPV